MCLSNPSMENRKRKALSTIQRKKHEPSSLQCLSAYFWPQEGLSRGKGFTLEVKMNNGHVHTDAQSQHWPCKDSSCILFQRATFALQIVLYQGPHIKCCWNSADSTILIDPHYGKVGLR